jgi:hypothetical protein
MHILMGYGAITFDYTDEGRKLAQYAKGGSTVIDAWFRAAREIQPATNGAAAPDGPTIWVGAMWVGRNGIDPVNDHAWDYGSVYPISPTWLAEYPAIESTMTATKRGRFPIVAETESRAGGRSVGCLDGPALLPPPSLPARDHPARDLAVKTSRLVASTSHSLVSSRLWYRPLYGHRYKLAWSRTGSR